MTTSRALFGAGLLGLLTLAATAHADPGGLYTRGPAKLKLPPPADPAKPATPDPAKPPPAPTVPPEIYIKIEGTVGPIRDEQIKILDGLIGDCKDTDCAADELADLHFRKAELYALEQRYYHLESQRVAIELDSAKTAAAKAKLTKQQLALADAAKKSLVKAVIVYKALADNDAFKNYENMPKALFYYGYTLGTGGYDTEMRDVFDRLLREYPQTEFAANAHFAFADYHFENHQLADAEHRYKKVLEFPKSPLYWYAKYKLGWVKMNQGAAQEALEIFHDVAVGTKGDAVRDVLHRAAINDSVRAYAEVGNVRRAHDYFKKLDAKGAFAMYELLADILRDDGKVEKAVYVYRDLIADAPTDKDVCLWQHHVAEGVLAAGKKSDALDEIDNLAKLYQTLAANKTLPAAELDDCRVVARDMAEDNARAWHGEWAKTYDADTYALADRAYGVLLAGFPADDRFAENQYYRAELAWSRAERGSKDARLLTQLWDDAADRFLAVVDTGKVERKVLEESARAAVLSIVNARESDPRKAKLPEPDLAMKPGTVPAPRAIPADDQKVLAVFDTYLASVKDKANPERIAMLIHKGNLLRRYDHLEDAVPFFAEAAAHRSYPMAEDAINLMLDTYNRLARYDDLDAKAKEILGDTAFLADKPELAARLGDLDRTYTRKAAERLEAEGRKSGDPAKLIACGKAYAEIYNRDTEAKDADEVLYDAAVCFEDGKSVGLALDMYKKLEDMGTDAREDVRGHAVGRLGLAYARIAQYQTAAKYFELFYAKYAGVKGDKEVKDAKDALSDAVIYRKGSGDDDLAIKDTLLYVANRDAPKADKAEAFFNLYAVYEKQGDTDALIAHLRAYVAKYGSAGGAERLIQAYARLGQALWAASCPGALVDGSCIKVERETSRLRNDHCEPGVKITVIDRDARKAKDATAAFAKAIAAFDTIKTKDKVDDTARYWYAYARMYSLEPKFEAYLDLAFPANLDFDHRHKAAAAKSMARFDGWYDAKQARAKELKLAYQDVVAIHDPQMMIAAAARVGQIAQNAADSLNTAEIPKAIRPYAEAVDTYCTALADKTTGLLDITLDAYGACLDTSTTIGWFSDWSRLCERELGNLEAGKYPKTTEKRATPDEAPVITDIEPRAVLVRN